MKLTIYTDEMPESCWVCYLKNLENRCCHITRKHIKDWDIRDPDCPLRKLAENEKIGIFKFMGKGKPHFNNKTWIVDESD